MARTSILLGLALITAACGGGDSGPAGVIDNESSAAVRVINGTASPVRVTVDGVVRVSSLAASSVSAAIDLPEGGRTIELETLSGTTPTGAVTTADVETTLGRTRLVTVFGSASALEAAVLDTGSVPAPGTSKLRVVHLAATAPTIDVWRTQPDFPVPVIVMFPFPYGASSSFLQSDPGEWEVFVTAAGSADPTQAPLGTLSLLIGANTARTVVIFDRPGGGVRLEVVQGE